MISLSLPRSRNTCGWSNGGFAPTHMISCEPISITATPASLWKCGTTLSDIEFHLEWQQRRAQSKLYTLAATVHPIHRFALIPFSPWLPVCSWKFDTILPLQRSPSFVGAVVSQIRHTIWKLCENVRVFDEAGASWFSSAMRHAQRSPERGAVAACARGRLGSGRAGRSCAPVGDQARLRVAP